MICWVAQRRLLSSPAPAGATWSLLQTGVGELEVKMIATIFRAWWLVDPTSDLALLPRQFTSSCNLQCWHAHDSKYDIHPESKRNFSPCCIVDGRGEWRMLTESCTLLIGTCQILMELRRCRYWYLIGWRQLNVKTRWVSTTNTMKDVHSLLHGRTSGIPLLRGHSDVEDVSMR